MKIFVEYRLEAFAHWLMNLLQTEKEDDENKGDGDKATAEGAVDEEKELKKRQADKFRELLRDKVSWFPSWSMKIKRKLIFAH